MGRRYKGSGSIYQRTNGYWVSELNGKQKYSKTKQDARKKLVQMLKQVDELQPSKITVSEVIRQYIAGNQSLKQSTIERYQIAADTHLLPTFGKKKLHTLRAADIEAYYSSCGLSPSSIKLVHSVLSGSIKRAVRLGLAQHNICSLVLLPKLNRVEVELFTVDEVAAILEAAQQDRLKALWTLALTTGAKEQEKARC
jgi:integrase